MYKEIYDLNFFLNFFTSLIFILSVFLFSIVVSHSVKKKFLRLENYLTLIIFFLIFCLYSFLFNLFIFMNLTVFIKYIVYFLFLSKLIIIINNFYLLSKKIKLMFMEKKIFFLLPFFLISILPISDADSIASHLNVANYIYNFNFIGINLDKNIDFVSYANSDVLLFFSIILKSDNFGSQLNFFSLLLFFNSININKKNFLFLVISCPVFIFFISSQKLQLFFGILFLTLFILINENKIKNRLEISIFFLLISFYISGKLSYYLVSFPIILISLWSFRKQIYFAIINAFLSFLIVNLLIFLKKIILFSNPIAPFFQNYFSRDNYLLNNLSLSLRSSEGWINNLTNYEMYLKPFIPTSINDLTISLGIIFLIALFDARVQKKTKYTGIIIILGIVATGQALPRYYFEAFLIFAYYINFKNRIIKVVFNLQLFFVYIFSFYYIFDSYIANSVFKNNESYKLNRSYSYAFSKELDNFKINENILLLAQPRDSVFFKENYFSTRTLNLINSDEKKYYIKKFIKNNKIKYIVASKSDLILFEKCIYLKKIGEFKYYNVYRNVLRSPSVNYAYLYKIKNNNCN